MSTLSTNAPAPGFDLRCVARDEPVFAGAALVVVLSLVPTLLALGLDARLFQGENVWIKPIKFQVALAVYLATLAVYARWLPAGMTRARLYRAFTIAVVTAVALELIWVGGAAAAGVASHFNTDSTAMIAIYGLMGILALLLTSASTLFGVAIWRNRETGLRPGTRTALGLGLVLTLPLTALVAGYMSGTGAHHVGTPVTGAAVPIMGWSTEVGDLRVSHFIATHALHLVPGLAVLAGVGPGGAWVIAAGVAALVGATFAQAVWGLPLLAL